jgi:hypothetical protein
MRLIGDADEEQQREQAQSRDAFFLPVSPAFCGSLVLYRHCGQPGQSLFATGPFGFTREERENGLSAKQSSLSVCWITSSARWAFSQ